MSTTCDDMIPLLAAQPEGLLEDAERSTLEAHLLACATCPALARDLQASLAAASFEEREPPAATWDLIAAKIQDEREGRGPQTALRILLACTFCHGALDRKEAVYCAACLAPHHQDCIETHGRCAATGCGETRSVAPRRVVTRTRSRLRWLAVVAVAAVGGGGAIAALDRRPISVPLPTSPEALALTDEPGTPAPDYPWAPPVNEVTKKFQTQKLTFNFAATPLSEVVQFLQDVSGLVIRVSKAIDQEQVKVDLRLRDVGAWNSLIIIAEQTGFRFEVEEKGLHLAPPGEIPAERAWPKPFDVSGLFDADSDQAEIVRRLELQRLQLNFDAIPLGDALDTLHDLTGINFVVATAARDIIDGEQLKATIKVADAPVRQALDAVLSPETGLGWQLRDGVVLVRPAAAKTPSVLASKTVTIDLRGGTVSDLVQELGRQGVPAFASPSAWRSRGTFSLHVVAQPLEAALAALGSAATLVGRVVRPEGTTDSTEAVAIEGRVVSVRDALSAPLPPFTGVAAEVREHRERMMTDLASRHRARALRSGSDADLLRDERSVDLAASSILSLLRASERIGKSEQRARKIAQKLAGIEEELPRSHASRDEAKAARGTRTAAIEAQIAALDSESVPRIAALAKRVAELEKDKRSVEAERVVEDRIRAVRELEVVRRTYKDSRDALQVKLEDMKRELEVKLAKCVREIASLEDYQKQLLRDEGAVDRDRTTLRGLERGMRLSEAENPD
jgi:hypothetical protein